MPNTPAQHIAELRVGLGWSRERLAVELGVSWKAIQSWELGVRKPSAPAVKLLERLAREGKGDA